MIPSIIRKSQLEGASRLDTEYYQPEYLKIAKILRDKPYKKFSEVVSNIINGDEIREYVDEDGLPYLRVSDIKEFFIDLSSVVYISRESKIKQNIELRKGDILLSRSGSLGIAAVVTPDLSNSVISSHLMRIPVKNISPYFLVAFLNSKFGKNQIMQRNNGAVVPEINHPSLKEVLIPIFSERQQKEIEDLVKNAYQQVQKSNKIYSQAENLLLEELGLKDFKLEENLSYIINLSNVKSTHRADAEYFQPKYRMIEEKLVEDFKAKKIKYLDFIKITTGQYCEEYTTQIEDRPYIRGTDLAMGTVKLDDLVHINPKQQILSKKSKEGDVVVTRVGTIGISARLPKEVEGGTISDNLIRLRFPEKNLDSYYISLFFNSVGSQLMIRESRGSVQPRLNQETLKEIVLPILPKHIQQKIADLVRQSHIARKKAKELLEQAKRKVENLIK